MFCIAYFETFADIVKAQVPTFSSALHIEMHRKAKLDWLQSNLELEENPAFEQAV